MSTTELDPTPASAPTPAPTPGPTNVDTRGRRIIKAKPTAADRSFVAGVRAAAISTLLIMGLIGIFLTVGAYPALKQRGLGFLTENEWNPTTGHYGVASLLTGTLMIGLFALVLAVPIGFGAALFISEYSPRAMRSTLVSLVDLMAAVPSIIYAIWALFFLQPELLSVSRWVAGHFGSVLPFMSATPADTDSTFTSSMFITGFAVGVVVLPTVTSIMREVFAQAPPGEREGAIALGATKWGMIRTVVLPFGRSGIVGGIMLGLGRALGETIVVYTLVSISYDFITHPMKSGGNSIAAHIAARYNESASGLALAGLLGAGLVLFAFTLVVNTLAGVIVSRSRSGAATEI